MKIETKLIYDELNYLRKEVMETCEMSQLAKINILAGISGSEHRIKKLEEKLTNS